MGSPAHRSAPLPGNGKTPPTVVVVGASTNLGKDLLAAVALQEIHGVDGYRVTADGVFVVHVILLRKSRLRPADWLGCSTI
jgi:hypothetical protein